MAFSTIVLERLGKQRNIVSTSNPKMSKSSLIKENIASSDRYKEIRLKAIDAKKRWGDEQADLVSQIESKKQRIQHHSHSCSLTTNDTITQLNQQYHNVKDYNERKEREEIERLEQERIEKARIEQEQRERERVEKQRLERERIEKERLKRERIEKERLEKERLERERIEQERLERERLEKERIERERREKERLKQEHIEQERIEKERHEKERIEQERIEKEREKEQLELEHIEKERREQERIEQERIEKEWLEHERIKKEQREQERLKQQQLEQELIKKRLEQQQLEQERMEKERLERRRAEEERIKQDKIRQERAEQECLEEEKSREKEKSITQGELLRDRLEQDRRYNDFRDKERRNKEPDHQVHHGSRKLDESSSEKRGEENKIVEKGSIVGQEERDKHIQLGQVFSGLEVNGPVANNIPEGTERLPRKRMSEVSNSPEAYKKLKSYPSSPHTPIKNPNNATEVYQQTLHILNSSAEPNTNYIIPTLPLQIIPSHPLRSVSSVHPRVASPPPPKVVCSSPAKIALLSPPQPASPLPPKSNTIDIYVNDSTTNKNVDYPSPKLTTSTDTHTPSKPIGSSRTPNTSYTLNDEKFKQVFQSQYTLKNTPSYQGSLTGIVYESPMRTSDQLIPDSDDYPSPERLRNSRSPRSPFSTSGTPSRPLNSSQIVYSPQRPNIRGIDDDDSDFDMESVIDIQEEEPPEWTPMRMKTPKRV